MTKLMRLWKDEEGATAVEYGIMVALIAAVIVGIVYTLGQQLNTAFTNVSGQLTTGGVAP
ncbi:Flp family type IVb pilin [Anaeromyxobacter oryzae]|uniref:Pilin subunit protein n=1 Tax=Anaeromyxobacter oryzae TaxID=2918170 RepID=A0ABM7WP02_9BACT|nr:Flp family type IVb pilin [Anaeromyxobacter oryzae]BDG01202.1 pilin subunit protein [Anaeromyxobacter oryzae]